MCSRTCTCDPAMQAICSPSVIKSNRPPRLPSASHSEVTAVDWQLPWAPHAHARMKKKKKKATSQIYLSQGAKTARLRVRSRLAVHYASRRVCARVMRKRSPTPPGWRDVGARIRVASRRAAAFPSWFMTRRHVTLLGIEVRSKAYNPRMSQFEAILKTAAY